MNIGFATLLRKQIGIMIQDTNITPRITLNNLSQLPNMTRESALRLLDPSDKQNVPKAVSLMQHLAHIETLPAPANPTDAHNRHVLSFFAKTLNYFVAPFITVEMSLSEQVRSLAVYAHLAAALQIKHGTACFTGALYCDSQSVVKNVIFTIARMQLINPNLKFYIILEGSDRLEIVFSDCRTQDHGRNFDTKHLSEKLGVGTLVHSAYERNPDLDRGHRRLSLKDALGIDHCNPRSWTGSARVGDVVLQIEWDEARKIATNLLQSYLGPDAIVDFEEVFSKLNHDLLRPTGDYVGVRMTADDARSEEETSLEALAEPTADDVHAADLVAPTQPEIAAAMDNELTSLPAMHNDINEEHTTIDYTEGSQAEVVEDEEGSNSGDSGTDENDDQGEGMILGGIRWASRDEDDNEAFEDIPEGPDIDDFFPDSIESLHESPTSPLPSSSSTQETPSLQDIFEIFLMIEGRKYLKSSIVASYLSSNWSRKVTIRTLRARGVTLEDLRRGDPGLNSTELVGDDVVNAGDLVAGLVRVGGSICLAVMEVKGFRVGGERVLRTCVETAMLESNEGGKKVMAVVQIINLCARMDGETWEWSGRYVRLAPESAQSSRYTHRQFVLEIPAILLHPLSPTISEREVETTRTNGI